MHECVCVCGEVFAPRLIFRTDSTVENDSLSLLGRTLFGQKGPRVAWDWCDLSPHEILFQPPGHVTVCLAVVQTRITADVPILQQFIG